MNFFYSHVCVCRDTILSTVMTNEIRLGLKILPTDFKWDGQQTT